MTNSGDKLQIWNNETAHWNVPYECPTTNEFPSREKDQPIQGATSTMYRVDSIKATMVMIQMITMIRAIMVKNQVTMEAIQVIMAMNDQTHQPIVISGDKGTNRITTIPTTIR